MLQTTRYWLDQNSIFTDESKKKKVNSDTAVFSNDIDSKEL